MTESLFDRYTKLTNKSRELKSFSIEPKLSTCAVKPCPEVISFDEEKYRLSVLQKTFQICTHSLKFDSIKVILGAFQTFDKAQQNTAIGVRFTGAYTLEGENLMDPKFCIERDNHDNGFVTHNRGMDYRIPLQDDSRWKAVDHVCGEVLVSYSPGYEIYKIRKEN